MTTIKEVAKEAGVSIATVSHYLNKTRYVSPDLAEKVEAAMIHTGYYKKVKKKKNNYKVGKGSEIAIVIPNSYSALYSKLISVISDKLDNEGLHIVTYFHNDDIHKEKSIISNILQNKKLAGAIMVPVSKEKKQFKMIFEKNIPIVFLSRQVDFEEANTVLTDSKDAIYKGCIHLLKASHEGISLVIYEDEHSNTKEKIEGFRLALQEYNVPFNEKLMIVVNRNNRKEFEEKVKDVWLKYKPTTFLAGSNSITLFLLTILNRFGVDIPTDVSIVGFGDEEWSEIISPPLTNLKHNIEEMAIRTTELLKNNMDNEQTIFNQIKIPMSLTINRSTQVIGKGPFGEKPVSPDELTVSSVEENELKSNKFRVAISFHYGGTAWTRLYEKGIRDILTKYGVSIISITDAHFDPSLQVAQLEGLRIQKPDAIIAIPVDDELTAKKFKQIARESKLVFISNVPVGMNTDEYSSCVSVNERENGYNTAVLMGEYFREEEDVKVGFIGHGAPFYGTHLRDAVANEMIRTNFSNIEIVDEQYFYQIDRTYEICKRMLLDHPEIKGLYISWDQPALEAIKVLKELNRLDISIFTFDLDNEIATYLAKGEMVKGLTSQRPYEQGIAVGLATVKALINKDQHKYIAVHPYSVEAKDLLKAWKDIMSEPPPIYIEEIIKDKIPEL